MQILIIYIFSDDMDLGNVVLNNISLDEDTFDDDDSKTITHVRLMA